jgi:Lon protease-like protein
MALSLDGGSFMSGDIYELPLFPLNVVLFPGMILPLHIFEPRYRQMTAFCLEQSHPFGVVRLQPGSQPGQEHYYTVGTTASIIAAERLRDGRYNIMTVGQARFKVLEERHELPYLVGIVMPYEDVPDPGTLAGLYRHASDLFRRYLKTLFALAGKPHLTPNIPTNPEDLSYFIAYCLDMEDDCRQKLLELTSTATRLCQEINVLRHEEQFLRHLLASQHKQHGDDHALLN